MKRKVADALAQLEAVNERAIHAAGPRYTPGLDPSAPNIEIAFLLDAFDALSLADGWRDRLRVIGHGISERVDRNDDRLNRVFRRRAASPARLLDEIHSLEEPHDPIYVRRATVELRRNAARVVERLQAEVDTLWERHRQRDDVSNQERERLDYELRELRGVQDAVQELLAYLDGAPGQLLRTPHGLLLVGSWGTGKTHLLCDVARQRLSARAPALLLLATALPTNVRLIDGIAAASGLAGSGEELLRELDRLGEATQTRALLMIDAINEGDRPAWREQLSNLTAAVRRSPNVGLVVSCRRPFDESIVTDQAARHLVPLDHLGFQEQEFDAQLEYFRFYDLPAPSVPLLTPEFSRPLFLKILCESLRDLSKRTQRKRFSEIASGQKGMTYVLEYYTKKIGTNIERDLGLEPGACWRALKGTRPNSGLAGAMADQGSDWLATDNARAVLQTSLSVSATRTADVLRRLLHDGLLAEQVHWRNGQSVEGVQFAYQRFGDHLIARHLLEAHLLTDSEQAVKRCFYVNRPLGRIFQVDRSRTRFDEPGIASAIMLEFPERMKRGSLPRELLDYLPRRARFVGPIKDAFLDGLYWRSTDSFTDGTDRIVGYLLERADDFTRDDTLEVLVGLATRPTHPYSAERLAHHLARQTMAARDTTWSEYLRSCDNESNVHRFLAWIERSAEREDTLVRNEMRLLSLFLTASRRPLRDRATRGLVLRGSTRPDLLFDETLKSLTFNDHYVPERMLAAAYGVSMRWWADPAGVSLRQSIVRFARSLVKEMFVPEAPHATKHALRRGYALGVIALARQIEPRAIATRQVALLREPFAQIPSPFIDPEEISDAEVDDSLAAMHMDFRNYTLGRLFRDRGNYDDAHPGYQDVRRQVARRMSDLGYSASMFGELDRAIAQSQPISRGSDGSKTDRYGKKYSWIAFYEMYGLRGDLGPLSESRADTRTSDCDIDPSFPDPPHEWVPPLPELFADAPVDHAGWLTHGTTPAYRHLLIRHDVDGIGDGPWVLLNGFVLQSGTNDRESFTFLRGGFIEPAGLDRAREDVMALDYLGNFRIPDPGEDYYTYAGEVPWSPYYGSYFRTSRGAAKRHVSPLMERFDRGRWMSSGRIEVPTQQWVWESYHSSVNNVSNAEFPAPALCERLALVNRAGSFDLWDDNGRQASVYRRFGAEEQSSRSYLLYLRRDLLERYLVHTNQVLIWIAWGERNLGHRLFDVGRDLPEDVANAFQGRQNDFRELIEYGTYAG